MEKIIISCAWPDSNVTIFDSAGNYTIWVQYDDGTVTAESNRVTIRVREPDDEREKKALALVRKLDPAGALYEVDSAFTVRDEPGLDTLRQIAKVEGATVYPSYARVALATQHLRYASYSRLMRSEGVDIRNELGKVEQLLDQVSPEVKTLEPVVQHLRESIRFERQKLE